MYGWSRELHFLTFTSQRRNKRKKECVHDDATAISRSLAINGLLASVAAVDYLYRRDVHLWFAAKSSPELVAPLSSTATSYSGIIESGRVQKGQGIERSQVVQIKLFAWSFRGSSVLFSCSIPLAAPYTNYHCLCVSPHRHRKHYHETLLFLLRCDSARGATSTVTR